MAISAVCELADGMAGGWVGWEGEDKGGVRGDEDGECYQSPNSHTLKFRARRFLSTPGDDDGSKCFEPPDRVVNNGKKETTATSAPMLGKPDQQVLHYLGIPTRTKNYDDYPHRPELRMPDPTTAGEWGPASDCPR